MISTNSVFPFFVNRTRAEIVSAFGGSQVSSSSPPFTGPCQLPVSQASLSIEWSGALAVGGTACCIGMAFVFCNCFGTHPTSTTAAIMMSS